MSANGCLSLCLPGWIHPVRVWTVDGQCLIDQDALAVATAVHAIFIRLPEEGEVLGTRHHAAVALASLCIGSLVLLIADQPPCVALVVRTCSACFVLLVAWIVWWLVYTRLGTFALGTLRGLPWLRVCCLLGALWHFAKLPFLRWIHSEAPWLVLFA